MTARDNSDEGLGATQRNDMDKMSKKEIDEAFEKADTKAALELSFTLADGTKVSPRVAFLEPGQPVTVVFTPPEGDAVTIDARSIKRAIGALMLFDQLVTVREILKRKANDLIQVPTPKGVIQAEVGKIRGWLLQQFEATVGQAFEVSQMVAEQVVKEWTK